MPKNHFVKHSQHLICFISDLPEQNLIDSILAGYIKRARPVKHPDDTVNITMKFYLTKVADLVCYNVFNLIYQTGGGILLVIILNRGAENNILPLYR